MQRLIHNGTPSTGQLVRTLFWTLWVITIALTVYGIGVEFFGFGLFLREDSAPKLHMRGEAILAREIGSYAAIGLLVFTLLIDWWSRRLCLTGIAALFFFLVYLAVPRI